MATQNDGQRAAMERVALVCFTAGLGLLGWLLFSRTAQRNAPQSPRRKKDQPPTLHKNSEPEPRTGRSLPEQKLGDTTVPLWEMPTPEEKAKARPVRNALEQAVAQVDSPQKAAEVAEQLVRRASHRSADEVRPCPDQNPYR